MQSPPGVREPGLRESDDSRVRVLLQAACLTITFHITINIMSRSCLETQDQSALSQLELKVLLKTPWSWACLYGPLCWHLSQPPFHSHKVSMIFWSVLKYKLYFVKLPRWPQGKLRVMAAQDEWKTWHWLWWASNKEKWSRNEHISQNIKYRYGHTIGNKNVWAYSSQTLEGTMSLSSLPTLHPQNYLGIIDICEFWKFFF